MPRITITPAQGWVTIGPLGAATDFQIIEGVANITGETPAGETPIGFIRRGEETIQFGSGKTVKLRCEPTASPNQLVVSYEALA